jgi:hypothetical protein
MRLALLSSLLNSWNRVILTVSVYSSCWICWISIQARTGDAAEPDSPPVGIPQGATYTAKRPFLFSELAFLRSAKFNVQGSE